jgi:anti-anti-sigma regulatory factor
MSETSEGGNAFDAAAWSLVVLQPEIGLDEANALKLTLLASLEGPGLTLDASQVRQIGTAGVQVLVALALELKQRSKPLMISVASEAFYGALLSSGVERLIPQPELVNFD